MYDEETNCTGNCASCGGGCSGGQPARKPIEGPNVGKICKTHYCGTFDDGTEFDSSFGGEPLEFVCGSGMMIRGFDEAVAKMSVGETVNVHLMPEDAYGSYDPEAIFTVEIAQMPGAEGLGEGERVVLYDSYNRPIPVKVIHKDEKLITFDANSEMAGKELNFRIELVEVK